MSSFEGIVMPMKILIATDKFKGTLTADEAAHTIATAIQEEHHLWHCAVFPLADGGDGTSEILTRQTHGTFVTVHVHDPLLREVNAVYGISGDRQTAFIEMASASGLRLLRPSEYNVMNATTLGTGELIADALNRNVKHIVLGIGGSCSNDGGTGVAAALGYRFVNHKNAQILPCGKELINIRNIQTDGIHPGLQRTMFTAMCDVSNTLTGPQGAAQVYGPQKGATPDQIVVLDEGLCHLAMLIKRDLNVDVQQVAGSGAGGGMGGGAIAFLGAQLRRGVDVVFDVTNFEHHVRIADVVITGEGQLDQQTLQGKVISGVMALCKKYQKKIVAVVGRNRLDEMQTLATGLDKVFAITDEFPEEFALNDARAALSCLVKKNVASNLREFVSTR